MEIKAIENISPHWSNNPICPYCGYKTEYDLSDGLPEDELFECPDCEKQYVLSADVSIEYCAAPLENAYIAQFEFCQNVHKIIGMECDCKKVLDEYKKAIMENQEIEREKEDE